MTIARVLLLATFMSLGLSAIHAQTASQLAAPAATKPLVFEAVTIRPATEGLGFGIYLTPDGARTPGSSLKSIIRSAYGEYRDALWFGEPAWTDSARYAIEAKFDPTLYKDLTDDQRLAMVQAMLLDRFKLVVHRETRTLPLYNLVVAKGGPRLREADASKYMVDDAKKAYCRVGLNNFRQCTMAEFAKAAPSVFHLDRLVDDKTGLTNRYDFELHYTVPGMGRDDSPDALSIFTAMPEQIGLRLEPTKGPVSVFVVDHVDHPSEN